MKVEDIRKSVKGKKFSELTEDEWGVLFSDGRNLISTVCAHTGIIDDSATCGGKPVFKPKKTEAPKPKDI